jgi:Ca-activated chloride channel family protein
MSLDVLADSRNAFGWAQRVRARFQSCHFAGLCKDLGFSPCLPSARKRLSHFSTALAFFALLLVPSLPAQDNNTPNFKIESKLVNLFVNVTDQNGAVIGGLTKDDFRVAEDGRPQQIAIFERQSELPLSIVLAVDTSLSVRKDLNDEQRAAKKFARDLLRTQDQMSLLQISTYVTQVVPFTNNLGMIDHGLGSLRGGDATALYDAIYLGSQSLAPRHGRKVLVLVSDGGDTVKGTSYDDALEQALRGEVMIYSLIDVPIAASAGRDIGGEHALITLSEQTGGKSFYVDEGGLDKAFAKISDDLRTQYVIGYYPHNQVPGLNFHRVSVTVPRAAAGVYSIRCKTGYFSEPPAKPRHVPVD